MSKEYYIEIKLDNRRWTLIKTERRQTDALHYVKEHAHEHSRYPIRVVRVVRTTVFDGSK